MRRKYTPWILALTLSAAIPLAAVSGEVTEDVGDASSYAASEEGSGAGETIPDAPSSGESYEQSGNTDQSGNGEAGGSEAGGSTGGESSASASEEPSTPAPEPSTPATEPSTPAPTEPQASESEETNAPASEEPVTPAATEPSTPAATEPATPAATEPSTPAATEPSTPAPTEPSTPASEQTEPSTSKETQAPTEGETNQDDTEKPTEPETLPEETLLEDEEFDPNKDEDEEVDEDSIQGGSAKTVREHDETETEEGTTRGGNVADGGAGELYIAVHGYPVGDLTKNERTIYRFLRQELGLSKAAASGVLSNMYFESNFSSIAIGDGGTSLGLCQWHLGRCRSLMGWCEAHDLDYRSVEGQLEYLKYELENAYSGVLGYLYGVPDNAEGAYRAGYYFCMYFESPDSVRVRSDARGTYAKVTYYPSDLDKYLDETEDDTADDYELDGQIDRVLSAEVALDFVLLEDSQATPDAGEDLEVQEIVVEDTIDEDLEKESGKDDEIALAKKDISLAMDGKLTIGSNETGAAGEASAVTLLSPAESVSVIRIQSDAFKPGDQSAAAGQAGEGPEAQAK